MLYIATDNSALETDVLSFHTRKLIAITGERNHHNDETNTYNLQLQNVVCPRAHASMT